MEQPVFPIPAAGQRDALIDRWKTDPHATYRTWFLRGGFLKNFRLIRRGIGQIVREIEGGSFGNVYRGSTLATVVWSRAGARCASRRQQSGSQRRP